jgi:hypothetical protein
MMRAMRPAARMLLLPVPLLTMGACSSPQPRADVTSTVPEERALGLAEVGQQEDRARIPEVVALLDSADPGIRMFAIRTLERLTGETLGYDYAAAEHERAEAVDRWVRWVAEQDSSTMEEDADSTAEAGDVSD